MATESKIKEITVSLGMSIDKKGLWIKPGISIKIEVGDNDSSTREEIVARAFEVVEEEMNKEMTRLGIE